MGSSDAHRSLCSNSPPVPAGFELEDGGDAWLDRLRAAERPASLGRIGSYELLDEVSRGAQGVVFRARQPSTRRDIALKRLIAGSMASASARARFEREVEIASSMRHPNVVTIHGLEFVDDQPLLVMEWVQGLSLDRWAASDPHRPVSATLAVFLRICDAVQHAHQRGVIHRDLKPSNILVDAAGEPHVLDFGLAILKSDVGSEAARLTRTADFVGTPAYASPEQVGGGPDAVDVRSDVYSLAVILYQLLTGRMPYAAHRSLGELMDAIRHAEPPRPSSICPSLDGELDAILGHALAKRPEDRYPGVDALAADLRRYLACEPISIRAHTAMYQIRKLVRRHRWAFAGGAVVALLIVASGVTAVLFALRAERERAVAQAARGEEANARARADQVNAFLREMLTAADPQNTHGKDLTVREVLDAAAKRIDTAAPSSPGVEAELRATIGRTYGALGLHREAKPQFQRSLELLESGADPDPQRVAARLVDLAHTARGLGRLKDAEKHYRRALELRSRLQDAGGGESLSVQRSLATLLMQQGRLGEAEVLLRGAIRTGAAAGQADQSIALNADLGALLSQQGKFAESEAISREALAAARTALGAGHERTLGVLNNLAVAVKRQGRLDEADALFRELVESCASALGPDHRSTLRATAALASVRQATGRLDEAESLYRSAIERQRRVLGDADPDLLESLNNFATLLKARGNLDEATQTARDVVRLHKQIYGPDNPYTAMAEATLAEILMAGTPTAEAMRDAGALSAHSVGILERALPPSHPAIGQGLRRLDRLYGESMLNDPDQQAEVRTRLARWSATTRPASE